MPADDVRVRVNKDPTGAGIPIYFHSDRSGGELISISVTVSERAHVYLFNVKADGEVVQFYPNRLSGSQGALQAGATVNFPPSGATWQLNVNTPYGVDKVVAVASRQALDTQELARFARSQTSASDSCGDDCFAQSQIGSLEFATRLGIIVSEVAQSDWVTDTVQFQIRRK